MSIIFSTLGQFDILGRARLVLRLAKFFVWANHDAQLGHKTYTHTRASGCKVPLSSLFAHSFRMFNKHGHLVVCLLLLFYLLTAAMK